MLLGPSGAGKGTQGELLSQFYNIPWISTGEILRDAVSKGDELGKAARAYMEKGALVPDALIIEIVKVRLSKEDCKRGFILDGFPRTIEQAKELDNLLKEDAKRLKVIHINLHPSLILKRICGRRTCRGCGTLYHLEFSPPSSSGICDKCGSVLYQREDDSEDVVRKRIEVYNINTRPILGYYGERVHEVEGEGKIEEVFERIKGVI